MNSNDSLWKIITGAQLKYLIFSCRSNQLGSGHRKVGKMGAYSVKKFFLLFTFLIPLAVRASGNAPLFPNSSCLDECLPGLELSKRLFSYENSYFYGWYDEKDNLHKKGNSDEHGMNELQMKCYQDCWDKNWKKV